MSVTEIVLIVGVVAIAFYVISIYNGLVKARQMAEEAWSGIDVQLTRRADLIPSLVETVKGAAAHEKDTLAEVTKMRTRVQSIDRSDVRGRAEAESMLSQALGKLIAVAEDYPELRSNENFLELQRSLETIEGEVQMSRRYFNGAVRDMNVKVESFPSNLVANQFGFRQAEYFEMDDPADKAVPKVSFDT